jgi:hypothetical protein
MVHIRRKEAELQAFQVCPIFLTIHHLPTAAIDDDDGWNGVRQQAHGGEEDGGDP